MFPMRLRTPTTPEYVFPRNGHKWRFWSLEEQKRRQFFVPESQPTIFNGWKWWFPLIFDGRMIWETSSNLETWPFWSRWMAIRYQVTSYHTTHTDTLEVTTVILRFDSKRLGVPPVALNEAEHLERTEKTLHTLQVGVLRWPGGSSLELDPCARRIIKSCKMPIVLWVWRWTTSVRTALQQKDPYGTWHNSVHHYHHFSIWEFWVKQFTRTSRGWMISSTGRWVISGWQDLVTVKACDLWWFC